MPHPGQPHWPSSSRLQNTTVVSPSTAASVIVTPNSTVRTIVSATTAAAEDVGSDTGLPGGRSAWRRNLHHLPTGARLSSPTRPQGADIRHPHLHSIFGRANLASLGRFALHRGDRKLCGSVAVGSGVGAGSAARRPTAHAGGCFGRPRLHYVACEPAL